MSIGVAVRGPLNSGPIKEGLEMLVLSRKNGETIFIGDRIKVSVVKLDGGKVRLGVEAPANVRILRGELEQWSTVPAKKSGRTCRRDRVA